MHLILQPEEMYEGIQTDENTYNCCKCNKIIQRLESWNKHEITLTGVKPFSCSICEFRCSSSGDLKRHWENSQQGYNRGLRYHFFRYRYDTDTMQVWIFDTDTILILFSYKILIPILILILFSYKISIPILILLSTKFRYR